jgi:hypothetical protein
MSGVILFSFICRAVGHLPLMWNFNQQHPMLLHGWVGYETSR